MNKEEAKSIAKELVNLTLEVKERNQKIKELKQKLIDYTNLEDTCSIDFEGDYGYWVIVDTKTKYKLVEIPDDRYKVTVDSSVMPDMFFEQNIQTKFDLSKQGKKLLKRRDEEILHYLVPEHKKTVTVTNKR